MEIIDVAQTLLNFCPDAPEGEFPAPMIGQRKLLEKFADQWIGEKYPILASTEVIPGFLDVLCEGESFVLSINGDYLRICRTKEASCKLFTIQYREVNLQEIEDYAKEGLRRVSKPSGAADMFNAIINALS